MPSTEIALLIGWFVLYILLRFINVYFGSFLVFLTFIFAYIVSDPKFGAFYILLFLVAIITDLAINQIDTTSQGGQQARIGSTNFTGFSYVAFGIIGGLVIYFMISVISRQVGGNIVGVPNLAVTTPSLIAMKFKPVFESALGIIENTITFVVYDVLVLIFGATLLAGFSVFLGLAVAGLILAIFHVVAYNVSIALIIYAWLAFMMFILSKLLTKDSLMADTAHFTNNGVISVSRSLSIAQQVAQ